MWLHNFWIRSAVVLWAFGIGLGYVYWEWIQPKWAARELLERRIERMERKRVAFLSQFSETDALQARIENYESSLTFLRHALSSLASNLLSHDELEAFLRWKNALILKGPPTPGDSFFQQKFRATLPAHYDETLSYLRQIDSYSPSVVLSSLKMVQKDTGVTEPPLLEVELDTLSYFYSHDGTLKEGRTETSPTFLDSLGVRDPFVFVQKAGPSRGTLDPFLYLKEIIFRGPNRFAVINGEVVAEGDFVLGDILVKEISPHRMVISQKGNERIFQL